MARKRIDIDFTQMDKLLAMQATLKEVAFYFNCSEDTVERATKREKGMTFEQSFYSKPATLKCAVFCHCFQCILRAGRVKTTFWRKQGRDMLSVKVDHTDYQSFHNKSDFLRQYSIALSTSEREASAIRERATMIKL